MGLQQKWQRYASQRLVLKSTPLTQQACQILLSTTAPAQMSPGLFEAGAQAAAFSAAKVPAPPAGRPGLRFPLCRQAAFSSCTYNCRRAALPACASTFILRFFGLLFQQGTIFYKMFMSLYHVLLSTTGPWSIALMIPTGKSAAVSPQLGQQGSLLTQLHQASCSRDQRHAFKLSVLACAKSFPDA